MTKRITIAVSMFLTLLAFGVMPASAQDSRLTVERSEDRTSATATWTPSEGAVQQTFFYFARLLVGEEDRIGIGINLAIYNEFTVTGSQDILVLSALDPAREYLYGVGVTETNSEGKRVWSDVVFGGLPSPTSVQSDRAALAALYNATGGGDWRQNTNWLTDAPLSEWYGVETNADGRVVGLSLWLNNLDGDMPPELGNLAMLERLYLPFNNLTGDIPAELGMLYNLESLSLFGNRLTGEIPVQLGGLFRLEELYLSFASRYVGCIPVALQNVPLNDLTALDIPFCS